jgi:hypothetical protein
MTGNSEPEKPVEKTAKQLEKEVNIFFISFFTEVVDICMVVGSVVSKNA